MLFSIFLYIFFYCSSIVAISYTDFLTQISTGELPSSNSEGNFNYSIPEVKEIVKRSGVELTQIHEWLDTLPNLEIYSFDNANALSALGDVATAAYHDGYFGDFFYIWEVINHNGYSSSINDASSGELQYEIEQWLPNYPNMIAQLASTLSVSSIKNLYLSLNANNTSLDKRDTTSCHRGNSPNKQDCAKLEAKVSVHGSFDTGDKLMCYGECCVSWSAALNVTAKWVDGKLEWCEDHCVHAGYSCKIIKMNLDGKVFNFCTGSTSGCKG